jgi:hypothetical protein
VPHDSTAQHGWPAPPHAAHVPCAQTKVPPEHVSFAQHLWPAAPHATHCPPPLPAPLHATAGAVHCSFWQHGCPAPPHVPQLPFAQLPPMFGHAVPDGVQWSFTQQPPLAHVPSAQHG